MNWEVTLSTTNPTQGSNNQSQMVFHVDDNGDATMLPGHATRMFMALAILATRDRLGGLAWFGASVRQVTTNLTQAINLVPTQWASDYALLNPAFKPASLPAVLPAAGTVVGNAIYAGLGDALYVRKNLQVVDLAGPRKGSIYLGPAGTSVITVGTGLVSQACQSDINVVLNGLFCGAATVMSPAPIPRLGDPIVVKASNNLSNEVVSFTAGSVPSRLRSRTR